MSNLLVNRSLTGAQIIARVRLVTGAPLRSLAQNRLKVK